jgi:hypothetical protein
MRSDSQWLREGAHHALHDMNKGRIAEILQPILVALEGPSPSLTVPFAARTALRNITKKSSP